MTKTGRDTWQMFHQGGGSTLGRTVQSPEGLAETESTGPIPPEFQKQEVWGWTPGFVFITFSGDTDTTALGATF